MPLTPIYGDSVPIWEISGTVKVLGFTLPCRSVVIETQPKKLWMWSPVPMDAETLAALQARGEVTHIVSPSLMHYLFLTAACQHFPNAQSFGPKRLRKKRPDIHFENDLEEGIFEEHGIQCFRIAGMPAMDEWVFFHEPTSTLIVCDLIFNLHGPFDLVTNLVTRMFGTHKRLAISRLVKLGTKDRQRAKAGLERMLELPFERLIMAHGVPLKGPETKPRIKEILSWMLKK